MIEKDIRKLEKKIDLKMKSIRDKKITPKDSNLGYLFNILKGIDNVSYTEKLNKYKIILTNLKNN